MGRESVHSLKSPPLISLAVTIKPASGSIKDLPIRLRKKLIFNCLCFQIILGIHSYDVNLYPISVPEPYAYGCSGHLLKNAWFLNIRK